MKILTWTTLLCGALLSSCAPSPLLPPPPGIPTTAPIYLTDIIKRAPITAPPAVLPPPPAPEIPRHSLASKTITASAITFTIVTFDRRDHTLSVADQPGGPDSKWRSAERAGSGSLAAINGGFFTPEGKPLGLVITDGQRRGGLNRASSLGSGFFIGGDERLLSRESYLSTKPTSKNLLQTGPRLVWDGNTISGLSKGDNRPRSFLLWDGQHHFAIGHANSANLSSLANALGKQPISGFKIHHALNLDGGRSSDLWVSSSVNGGPLTRRGWLNKSVRNYLVLRRD